MDLFSLGFLLLILVTSGVVAFLADRLGKKLGKKRVFLRAGRFNLRPKHVAALGTIVMGVVVSALTIALVAAASRDARIWLREGRQLLVQLDQLRKERETLQTERGRLMREAEELGGANERLKGSNESLTKQVSEQQKSLKEERARLQRAQDQRARLESEAERLGTLVASLKGSLRLTETNLSNIRRTLATNQLALIKARTDLLSYERQIRLAEVRLKTFKKNADVANENWQAALKKSQETYLKLQETHIQLERTQAEVDAAKSKISELTTEREKAERDLEAAQKQYTATQAQLDAAKQELIQVQNVVDLQQVFLNSAIRAARTEPLTFRAKEEISRFVVPGGSDAQTSRAALTSLIRLARLEATDRGAKRRESFEVADVFDRQDPKTGARISSEELKGAVVSRVAGRVEDQVLVATSSFNAFASEPVSLDISVLPNPVIYHQGEMLSEARIDGSLPEDQIYGQISDFVRSRVRERAAQDRMIPKSGTDAPFGEVPRADMFALVREIKRVGRSVRVQAFAGEDIHAADPLRLEFRLK
ncbi:DUF3084 domain-containing protein [bacterium]|nr:MAG: DUF3084 domain-containing protein [bacterium]